MYFPDRGCVRPLYGYATAIDVNYSLYFHVILRGIVVPVHNFMCKLHDNDCKTFVEIEQR